MEPKYVKIIGPSNIKSYSSISDFNIGGIHDKVFARIDSIYLYPLIFSLKCKSKNHYVTYVNDLLESGSSLSSFSVLMKYSSELDEDMLTNEILGSRLCNLYGVPTVYNECFKCDDMYLMCSVDFLKNNESFETVHDVLNEREPIYNLPYTIEKSKLAFDRVWFDRLNNSNEKHAESQNKFIDDILEMYFFRSFVLLDSDFAIHNIGMVIDPDNRSINVAPAHDFEFLFYLSEQTLFDDIKYFLENYPDQFKKCLDKLNSMCLAEVFRTIDQIQDPEKRPMYLIETSIENLNKVYKDFIDEKQVQGEWLK